MSHGCGARRFDQYTCNAGLHELITIRIFFSFLRDPPKYDTPLGEAFSYSNSMKNLAFYPKKVLELQDETIRALGLYRLTRGRQWVIITMTTKAICNYNKNLPRIPSTWKITLSTQDTHEDVTPCGNNTYHEISRLLFILNLASCFVCFPTMLLKPQEIRRWVRATPKRIPGNWWDIQREWPFNSSNLKQSTLTTGIFFFSINLPIPGKLAKQKEQIGRKTKRKRLL